MILVVTVHNLCIYGVTESLPILQTNKKKESTIYTDVFVHIIIHIVLKMVFEQAYARCFPVVK